ncbi:MAG: 2Fe-2S iron-sulfur cluster-binding protein, partial [Chloroflexota bacterium]
MKLKLTINAKIHEIECQPGDTLFTVLRRQGYYGVKFGDEQGLSGSDTVILDSKPVNSSLLLAAQAEGHLIVTIEGLGEHPDQGWRKTDGLHPIQQAFVESGAIQCGYCTPAQVLAAKALLDKNPNPTEEEVREAISGVLCRCTGYAKPVQAILRAAAVIRGETFQDAGQGWEWVKPEASNNDTPGNSTNIQTRVMPKMVLVSDRAPYQTVGKPEKKVDAIKLVQGKPAFTADLEPRGMLHAK